MMSIIPKAEIEPHKTNIESCIISKYSSRQLRAGYIYNLYIFKLPVGVTVPHQITVAFLKRVDED